MLLYLKHYIYMAECDETIVEKKVKLIKLLKI